MTNIVVPELGESVVEARIARWLKKEGDRVEVGEPVVELETEKIDLEVNAEKGGVIASIKRQEGDDVKIGELLAVLDESAVAQPASANGAGAAAAAQAAPAKPAEPQSAAADAPKATPTARRIARDHAVNLGSVQGSGASGRVMKQDVQNAIAKPPAATQSAPAATRPVAPAAPRPAGERSERRERSEERRGGK